MDAMTFVNPTGRMMWGASARTQGARLRRPAAPKKVRRAGNGAEMGRFGRLFDSFLEGSAGKVFKSTEYI
ncbi:hypothetical protein BOSEA31B_14171 [Hyphomicrobiales bacterium]|nr:hypothetical protein BOSEA31B_14171 [Hyphomicrobiales bacterium]CAH1699948.1 hypothetical protein BOSEA1005_13001 [Hyphomicrobiales bacterium]